MAHNLIEAPTKCFTIEEFCRAHRVGRSTYYRLREEGRGPDECRLLGKIVITKEAAARWRAERDAEAKHSHEKGREALLIEIRETYADSERMQIGRFDAVVETTAVENQRGGGTAMGSEKDDLEKQGANIRETPKVRITKEAAARWRMAREKPDAIGRHDDDLRLFGQARSSPRFDRG